MNQTPSPRNLSDRTELAIREVVGGRRSGLGAALLFAGPAVMASIAYMDPGNFATNFAAGAVISVFALVRFACAPMAGRFVNRFGSAAGAPETGANERPEFALSDGPIK